MNTWNELRPDAAKALWTKWEPRRGNAGALSSDITSGPLSDAYNQIVRDRAEQDGDDERGVTPSLARGQISEEDREAADKAAEDGDWSSLLGDAEDAHGETMAEAREVLDLAHPAARVKVKEATTDEAEAQADALKALDEAYVESLQMLVQKEIDFRREVEAIRGEPIFDAFTDFQGACVRNALHSVVRGNITGGLQALLFADTPQPTPLALAADPNDPGCGFLYYLAMSVYGVVWLFATHWVYAAIYTAFALAVWALFGGAIFRIAALHAAREEKASIGQALRFSASKFLSFFMAPLIPIGAIVFFGLLMLSGGLLANLWGVGAIIVGALFFLAVLGGLAIAFLTFGLIGGGGLMYPTIAVEGSDSFDAISRSYSYIFNRPWRSGLYSLLALFHGTVCYLIVRLFGFVALRATHLAVKSGIWTGGQTLPDASDKLDVMWTAPTFDLLHAPMQTAAMTPSETIGAYLITFWVYLVVGVVAAFLVSYFISGSTVIYYLLRRHVDATDLDDVFVEEAEEDELAEPEVEAPAAEETESAEEDKAEN
ncbi:MAG: hypothetical protein ACYTFO_10160, partial [Planctomycetota bacterium]|jgi:hypothetical protein